MIKWDSPGAVISDFMRSDAFVRALRGPVGAGKSVTCAMEVMRKAIAQAPNTNGVRKSRWAVVRNTNPQLKTTTIKTWRDWFDDSMGKMRWSPPYTHHVKFDAGDNTMVDAEVIFLALDRPEDVKKLLSLELTGVWVNEAREVSKTIIDACTMRVGRFPAVKDGGPSWYGVIMDTNSPDEEHWWAIMSGEVPAPEWMTPEERLMMIKPEDWEFFNQPPAMIRMIDNTGELTAYELNPGRENADNLVKGYYEKIITGKSASWIRVYILNEYQSLSDGKPVHPTFKKAVHVASHPIEILSELDIYVGIDFGRTPAAVIGQQIHSGRWVIQHEVLARDMGATRFAEHLKRQIMRFVINENQTIHYYGDPAGSAMPQTDDMSAFMIFRQAGIPVRAAPTNDIEIRIEAVDGCLNRLVDGKPGLLISPICTTIINGLSSGYQFRRKQVGGHTDLYEETPLKNRYSHPLDGLQYLLLGGGEGRRVLTGHNKPAKVSHARFGHADPFKRKPVARKVRGRL